MESQQVRLFNAIDAAAYLGVSLSKFRDNIRKDLPVVQIGKSRPKYDVRDLDKYIEANRIVANA